MNNEKSLFTIYSQRLAGYLMLHGIPLIMMGKDKMSKKNNFIFPNTDDLKKYIEQWKVEYNKGGAKG